MNVGSLFAGIGGFDLGLQRAGMRVDWQVELDPHCRAVLARHFPEAERFEDVRAVGAASLAPVDLICGGFPCQDLSAAGKGAGLAGARSGLWAEYARIVCELRPRYVVVENVPALLTGKGKRWDRAPVGRVLGDLAEAGYDAEWACLSAREFGAPHLRKRVWIVAYPARDAEARPAAEPRAERQRAGQGGAGRGAGENPDAGTKRCQAGAQRDREETARQAPLRRDADRLRHPLADSEGNGERPGLRSREASRKRRRRPVDSGRAQGDAADADSELQQGPPCLLGRAGAAQLRSPWAAEPDVGRVADGVPARVDRLAALGNALLPQIAEWVGRRILEYEARAGEGMS